MARGPPSRLSDPAERQLLLESGLFWRGHLRRPYKSGGCWGLRGGRPPAPPRRLASEAANARSPLLNRRHGKQAMPPELEVAGT